MIKFRNIVTKSFGHRVRSSSVQRDGPEGRQLHLPGQGPDQGPRLQVTVMWSRSRIHLCPCIRIQYTLPRSYRKYILQITQPSQYRYAKLQYRFVVTSGSPRSFGFIKPGDVYVYCRNDFILTLSSNVSCCVQGCGSENS